MEGSINFTYEELARLNRMIGIALMSGKMNEVSGDKISKSVHKKISDEICRWNEKNFAGMDRKRNKIKESRIRRGAMQRLLDAVNTAIEEEYNDIKKRGKVYPGIEKTFRDIRWKHPELAVYVKKRMLKIAEEKGDLP